MAKNNGIVRRPIEYLLVVLAMGLAIFLLWAIWVIREDNMLASKSGSSQPEMLLGSVDEIDGLAESDTEGEKKLDEKYDQQELEAASADSAADNVGGVYDETAY